MALEDLIDERPISAVFSAPSNSIGMDEGARTIFFIDSIYLTSALQAAKQ
jgi:hypothetical protein